MDTVIVSNVIGLITPHIFCILIGLSFSGG
jgi:hypothetical protein